MSRESFVFALAGMFLGLLGGWIIGSQTAQPPVRSAAPQAAQAQAPQTMQPPGQPPAPTAPPPLDEARVAALRTAAARDARDAGSRVALANLYLDSERYDEAVRWYQDALAIDPKNVNASTDLGIAYYYSNQADRALAQFEKSLAVDPRHSKTLLNMGIVRAFAKEDVAGATSAWEKALAAAAPGSVEASTAKRLLDGIRAHPTTAATPTPRSPGTPD